MFNAVVRTESEKELMLHYITQSDKCLKDISNTFEVLDDVLVIGVLVLTVLAPHIKAFRQWITSKIKTMFM